MQKHHPQSDIIYIGQVNHHHWEIVAALNDDGELQDDLEQLQDDLEQPPDAIQSVVDASINLVVRVQRTKRP